MDSAAISGKSQRANWPTISKYVTGLFCLIMLLTLSIQNLVAMVTTYIWAPALTKLSFLVL